MPRYKRRWTSLQGAARLPMFNYCTYVDFRTLRRAAGDGAGRSARAEMTAGGV